MIMGGEQTHFSPDNKLGISMVHLGLETEQSRKIRQPLLNWLAPSSAYMIESASLIGSMPFRHCRDVDWRKEHHYDVSRRTLASGLRQTT